MPQLRNDGTLREGLQERKKERDMAKARARR